MRAAAWVAVVLVSGCSAFQMPHKNAQTAPGELWAGRPLYRTGKAVQMRQNGLVDFVQCFHDCPQPTPKVMAGMRQSAQASKASEVDQTVVIQVTGEWNEGAAIALMKQLAKSLPRRGFMLNMERKYAPSYALNQRERTLFMALVGEGVSLAVTFLNKAPEGAVNIVVN